MVENAPSLTHAGRHATGQPDAIAPASIGAAPSASPAFTGTPTTPTAVPGTNNTQVASTAYADASAGAAVTSSGQTFVFSQDPAVAPKTSGLYPPTGVTLGHWAVRLECTSAPVGSALAWTLRYTSDHGVTWTTISSLSIASGATTLYTTATVVLSVPAGAQLGVNATSAGSTTPAANVVLSAVATP